MELIKCAFCGRTQGECFSMIRRHPDDKNANICSECIGLCNRILSDKAPVKPGKIKLIGDFIRKEMAENTTTVRGVDVQKNGAHYGEETVVKAPPYRLSEKYVYEMWAGVKKQAEDALQFLFVTSEVEAHKDNDPLSKWIVVVYEDRVCFERFGDGVKLEGYVPVPPAEAAVYAAAIVNGLEPPKYLRPCDKPID